MHDLWQADLVDVQFLALHNDEVFTYLYRHVFKIIIPSVDHWKTSLNFALKKKKTSEGADFKNTLFQGKLAE